MVGVKPQTTLTRTAWRLGRSGVRRTRSACLQLCPHTACDLLRSWFITTQSKTFTGSMNVNKGVQTCSWRGSLMSVGSSQAANWPLRLLSCPPRGRKIFKKNKNKRHKTCFSVFLNQSLIPSSVLIKRDPSSLQKIVIDNGINQETVWHSRGDACA